MSRRWRFLWLVPLALLLVIGAERLSSRTRVPDEQAAEETPARQAADTQDRSAEPRSRKIARLVPLYPVGDLYVPQPEPVNRETPVDGSQPVDPAALPSPPLEGKRPVLEVGYEEIGFERYLDIIERVGRFFVLTETENGAKLGPEVSLREMTVKRSSDHDMEALATSRPHLVSDPRIQVLLMALDLPADTYPDRVVLILNKPFDTLLWDVIGDSLAGQGFALGDIARIKGAYEEGRNGVFLRLETAVAKSGRRQFSMDRKLRVSL